MQYGKDICRTAFYCSVMRITYKRGCIHTAYRFLQVCRFLSGKLIILSFKIYGETKKHTALSCVLFKADDGNRTRAASLEGWNSTIEQHPHATVAIIALSCVFVNSVFGFFSKKLFLWRAPYSVQFLRTSAYIRSDIMPEEHKCK